MLSKSSLARFLRQQGLYLSMAAIATAVFWANNQKVNPATVVLYAVLFGNLGTPPMNHVRRTISGLAFPMDWLAFLAAMFVLTPILYAMATVAVWWIAPPFPQALGHLIRTGWKFPCLVLFVYGLIWFLYQRTKDRLERRNAELQRSLKLSAAQLSKQEEELQRAQEIQVSLLPKEIPQIPGFELAPAWQPARMVGGDYFDVVKLSETRLAVCVADVAGKGVPAALLMANVQATVRAFARSAGTASDLCSRVNGVLCGNIDNGRFVTFFYGVLDADHGTLQYCNAGHPRPILISADTVTKLPEGGAVLGVFPEWKYEDSKIELKPGDRLLLFTDGITEASNENGEEFGEDNLAAAAKANVGGRAGEINRRVLSRVNEFCRGQFADDATLLVIAANR